MDVPKSVTPPLLLPGQSVLHVYPTPGHASVTLGLPSAPVRNEIQSGSGHAGRARALEAQWGLWASRPQARGLQAKCQHGAGGRAPPHPTPSLRSVRPRGSVLPGPGKEDTHFRRVHDLPRLLLTLAACAGAGHRDNRTGQRSPPFLAGFRRTGKGASLCHTVSALPALQPAHALGLPVEGRLGKDRENWDSGAL